MLYFSDFILLINQNIHLGSALAIFITILTLCISYAAFSLHQIHQKFDHIPGPKRKSFWFGNIDILVSEAKKGHHFGDVLVEMAQKYGHTFKLMVMHRPIIVTVEPETVKELLVAGKYSKSNVVYNRAGKVFGARCLGQGLVTITDQQQWYKNRNTMNPAFKKEALKEMISNFNEAIDQLIVQLQKAVDTKTSVTMVTRLAMTTLDTLGKVGFNRNIRSLHNNDSSFPSAVRDIMDGMSAKRQSPFEQYSPTCWPFRRKVRNSIQLIRDTGKTWIMDRVNAINNDEKVPNDILTHLTQLIGEVDFESLLDEFCTFFIAGQETVSNATSFAVYFLCTHPEKLKRLTEEIDSVVGRKAIIDYNDISKMRYLDMVWKETLRLQPPSVATVRTTREESQIGGYHIPPNSDINMSSYVSSRLPEFNENPLEFNPERFSDESPNKPNIYTYYPFALGSRICVGQQFAKIEGKLIITKIFQNFEVALEPDQSFEVVLESTMKFKEGLRCTFKSRN